MADDYVQLIAAWPRPKFVSAHPFPFLVGAVSLNVPLVPRKTQRFSSYDTSGAARRDIATGDRRPIVLPVRKTQEVFPTMITVGRTRNNDIVVSDVLVSKFHAFFRAVGDGWELADAGSQNGTRVAGVALVPRGAGQRVALGDHVRFADTELTLLDAGESWDTVRLHLSGAAR